MAAVGSWFVSGRGEDPHVVRAVGRDVEVAAVAAFFARPGPGPVAAVLDGAAGIGKTTVWREALRQAGLAGWSVVTARPRETEAAMPFAGLHALLGKRLDEVAAILPLPQREALDIALLRVAPGSGPVDPRTVATATLSAVSALGQQAPLLLAIDDLQWLDDASAEALRFVARRLAGDRVRLLVTWRSEAGRPDLGVDEDAVEHVVVAALGPESLRVIVEGHLGATITLAAARTLHQVSGGNPFYALELARSRRDGDYGFDRPLVLEDVRVLIGRRFSELPARVTRVLATVSALADDDPGRRRRAGIDGAELDAAFVVGLVVEDAQHRVHFAHPLLAAAAYAAVPPGERRTIHRQLAASAVGAEERARHLALAATEPDATLASAIEAGAKAAGGRGAASDAARLSELAAQLTPTEDKARAGQRLLMAARWYTAADEIGKAAQIWTDLIETCPAGETRAEALSQLASSGTIQYDRAFGLCEQAIAESTSVRSRVQHMVIYAFVTATRDARRALEIEKAAAAEARAAGDELALCSVLPELGLDIALTQPEADGVEVLREGIVLANRIGFTPRDAYLDARTSLGFVLVFRGELTEARELLSTQYQAAMATGDERSAAGLARHLCELECTAGHLAKARQYADQIISLGSSGRDAQAFAMRTAHAALLEAHLGDIDRAGEHALRALEVAESVRDPTSAVASRAALGFIELSRSDPHAALQWLEPLLQRWRASGYREPGSYAWVPDRLEALIAVGRYDETERDTADWEELGRALDRRFPLATGARCRGLLLAARGEFSGALESLNEALGHHERLEWPHQRARTLLAFGRVARRAGRRREARTHLEAALAIFSDIGEPLWADQARSDLGRISGRTPAGDKLTDAERRIVDLVATGRSNRDVAKELFISVRTVEATLTRAYAKLGIRSRAELAARWAVQHDS